MRHNLFLLIISLFAFSACAPDRNESHEYNRDLTENEQELIDFVESLDLKEGTLTLDSADAEKMKEITENIIQEWREWQEVKSTKGNFRIEFPKFEVKKEESIQIIEEEEVTIYSYKMNLQDKDHENVGYMVDYAYWSDVTTEEEIKEQFDVQRDYLISATNATLEYETLIDLDGVPGRELYFTVDGSNIKIKYRMYLHNDIYYKLAVLTAEGHLFNKSISRFFDSFEILKK